MMRLTDVRDIAGSKHPRVMEGACSCAWRARANPVTTLRLDLCRDRQASATADARSLVALSHCANGCQSHVETKARAAWARQSVNVSGDARVTSDALHGSSRAESDSTGDFRPTRLAVWEARRLLLEKQRVIWVGPPAFPASSYRANGKSARRARWRGTIPLLMKEAFVPRLDEVTHADRRMVSNV